MTRVPQAFRESTLKKKDINPIWRGVGFILILLLTIGAFWLAGYVLDRQLLAPYLPFPVPQDFLIKFSQTPWLPPIPGKLAVQIGAAVLIDILGFALLTLVWSIINPVRPGPKDAPQPRGRGRRSLVR
jgi:hypothetical protein